jgi:hypothetical protein
MPRPAFHIVLGLLGLATAALAQPDSTNGWGYPLDSLTADLSRWRANPLMKVDSIGRSVQNRPIWRITVGEEQGVVKPRVFVHARTHPAEVQAFYVLREMMGYVADPTNDTAAALRRDFVFHFIPMYNPDGVALGKSRQNANGVDIEGNWNQPTLEPEVAALKATFQTLSAGPAKGRIRAALNLHSDQVNCTRFFFYHDANGTSADYAARERDYITRARAYFPEGIEDWNYVVAWADGFKSQYPESFWWQTQGVAVMALTYEDTNCPGAGDFYFTGRAIALGTADYLRSTPVSVQGSREHGGDFRGPQGVRFERGVDGRGSPVLIERKDGRVIYRDLNGKVLRVEP